MAKLEKLLELRRAAIAKMWLDALLDTYPPDTVTFLKGDNSRFTNPVGHILSEGVNGVLAGLIESDEDRIRQNLTEILKVRSIQNMAPSKAVSFLLLLKDIVRKALESRPEGRSIEAELTRFDARIDQAILIAFDLYAECRERVCELRVTEVKRNVSRILKLSGYLEEDPVSGPDREPGSL